MSGTKKIRATLVKSPIGSKADHRACAKGLGFKRLNQTVELEDTPSIRGMINKIAYLLKWETV
jgi:large subunit ribosomal protein L30